MIIVYGESHFGKGEQSGLIDTCGFCGKRLRLENFTARKFFTLYWLPIIPMARERVIRYCRSCKKYQAVAFKNLSAAIAEMAEEGRRQLAANQPADVGGIAIQLGNLGRIEDGLALCAELRNSGHQMPAGMAASVLHEMRDDLALARQALVQLIQLAPEENAPRLQLAQLLID